MVSIDAMENEDHKKMVKRFNLTLPLNEIPSKAASTESALIDSKKKRGQELSFMG